MELNLEMKWAFVVAYIDKKGVVTRRVLLLLLLLVLIVVR